MVHGSFGWGEDTFGKQRPLSDQYRLKLVDRRGFGKSPLTKRVDFDSDANDIANVLSDGAHLVGHSYGAVVSLLAARRRPNAVKSLTVIEPPAFKIAHNRPYSQEYCGMAKDGLWKRNNGHSSTALCDFLEDHAKRASSPLRRRHQSDQIKHDRASTLRSRHSLERTGQDIVSETGYLRETATGRPGPGSGQDLRHSRERTWSATSHNRGSDTQPTAQSSRAVQQRVARIPRHRIETQTTNPT